MTNIEIDKVELYRFSFPNKFLNEYNRFSYINKTKYRGAVINVVSNTFNNSENKDVKCQLTGGIFQLEASVGSGRRSPP